MFKTLKILSKSSMFLGLFLISTSEKKKCFFNVTLLKSKASKHTVLFPVSSNDSIKQNIKFLWCQKCSPLEQDFSTFISSVVIVLSTFALNVESKENQGCTWLFKLYH